MRRVRALTLVVAAVISGSGQEIPSSPTDPTKHLERDLQGPRLDAGNESPSNLVGPTTTYGPGLSRDAGLISIATLRHKIPKNARQSFDRATKYSKNKDYWAAAAELQKALAISPEFIEARVNLGVQYIRLGLLDTARAELDRALERDPTLAAVQADLAIVFLEQGNAEKASGYARHAVQLEPGNYQSHYLLGMALSGSPETISESIEHFRIAADHFPQAKRELARLQASQ